MKSKVKVNYRTVGGSNIDQLDSENYIEVFQEGINSVIESLHKADRLKLQQRIFKSEDSTDRTISYPDRPMMSHMDSIVDTADNSDQVDTLDGRGSTDRTTSYPDRPMSHMDSMGSEIQHDLNGEQGRGELLDPIKCLDHNMKLSVIKHDQTLNRFCDGVIFKLGQSYAVAVAVDSGVLSISTSSTSVDMMASVISMIPAVGGIASSAVTKVKNLYIEQQAKHGAACISEFAFDAQDFSVLVKHATVDFIFTHQESIRSVDMACPYLESRWKKIKHVATQFVQSCKDSVYGQRMKTEEQKFGAEFALRVIEAIVAKDDQYNTPVVDMQDEEKVSVFTSEFSNTLDKMSTEYHSNPDQGTSDDEGIEIVSSDADDLFELVKYGHMPHKIGALAVTGCTLSGADDSFELIEYDHEPCKIGKGLLVTDL